MSQPDREVEPFFSQPIRQVTMMLVALVLFGLGVYIAYPRVAGVFLSSPYLNGFIVFVFVIGLITCVYQVVELVKSVSWIMAFTRASAVPEDMQPSRLLAPLAALMRGRGVGRLVISSTSSRSILESVATRIEEARDVTRYISNLLIFLGLLGTFYGLATTVPAVVETIRALAPSEGDSAITVFSRLMTGLESQLGGMGTAFASSLLGLAGSLVIGLLELFANHGQNRFYRELEDWLSSITRLGFAASEGETTADTAIINALAEHMAEQMDALQTLYTNSDVSRAMVDERLGRLAGAVERLAERLTGEDGQAAVLKRLTDAQGSGLAQLAQVQGEGLTRLAERQDEVMGRLLATQDKGLSRLAEAQEAMVEKLSAEQGEVLARVASGQERMIALMEAEAEREAERARARLEAERDAGGPHVDAESRMRLRSIDVQLLRILEEMAAGRQESLTDLRSDLATLTKAVRMLAREPSAAPPIHARRG